MEILRRNITIFSSPCPDHRSSRSLLLAAAQSYSGLDAQELGKIEANAWGKPFFIQHPDLHFSITHSGDWWMCAFSDVPIGLDLQIHRIHRAKDAISKRFFHPQEDAFLTREDYLPFFDLWAAKESWAKYQGHGFTIGTKTFSVVSPDGAFPFVQGAHLRLFPFAEGYSLCLCTHIPKDIHFLSLDPCT